LHDWFPLACLLLVAACDRPQPPAAKPGTAALASATQRSVDERPFPRSYEVGGKVYEVHQPQLESWDGRTLKGRFALAVKTGTRKLPDGKQEAARDFGVVWFTTTTQIDKGAGEVLLSDMRFDRANFPNAHAREADYLQVVRAIPGRGATWTLSLEQLEAGLAVSGTRAVSRRVRSEPPDLIFSTQPAALVLVDGKPVLRPVAEGIERVVNTRSLLLLHRGAFHTRMAGHWASAPTLSGPWTWGRGVDPALEAVVAKYAPKTETNDKPSPALQRAFANGSGPDLYVRMRPAELIAIRGDPVFTGIPGTTLGYVENTGADIFIDSANGNAWYVLVSGRWFTAPSSRGPWSHVARGKLPADFGRIPPDSPKSGVLASIPGTPESREALIADSIPQTATVVRSKTQLQVPYDGEPAFLPIEGTSLEYAHNSPVPVIHVRGSGYYAVDKGIWFSAKAPTGPWQVADSVPAEIYSIPTSSPLHYVTYVQVYGSNGDEVYVGYTPGYYGTVVSDDVVVYGTGYECDPWVGTEEWYGCPATYGMGTYFGWNPYVGWSYGWGWGWNDGWFGPGDPWWGPWRGENRPWGWWRGGAAGWNVYQHWANSAVRGDARAWADRATGDFGRAARGASYNPSTGVAAIGRAGRNTNLQTGRATAFAQGLRYDTDTGRVTGRAGVSGIGPGGAAAVGAISSRGPGGDVSAIGGARYSHDTGLHTGAIAKGSDSVYASRDGEIYRYRDGNWSKIDVPKPPPGAGIGRPTGSIDVGETVPGRGAGAPALGAGAGAPPFGAGAGAPPVIAPIPGRPDLDQEFNARQRGYERTYGGGNYRQPSHGGGQQRPVGGYRPSLGSGSGTGASRGGSGGFSRGGGGRR
jgi:hypothetical protein